MQPIYLVRFDDICPTMNWRIWDTIEAVLEYAKIKPILAVIPNNKDKNLVIDAPRADFWEKVREWQAKDWTIGLHGYEHCYVTQDSGLLKINQYSEFASVDYSEQRRKFLCALEIFHREKVIPKVWIAPAHSFDNVTIKLLKEFGLKYISDGFSLWPYVNDDIMWVPQQLWKFRKMPFGVWTICFHHNGWNDTDVYKFTKDMEVFSNYISNFDEICTTFQMRYPNVIDTTLSLFIYKAITAKKKITSFLNSNKP